VLSRAFTEELHPSCWVPFLVVSEFFVALNPLIIFLIISPKFSSLILQVLVFLAIYFLDTVHENLKSYEQMKLSSGNYKLTTYCR
jgi:hypothetical protein